MAHLSRIYIIIGLSYSSTKVGCRPNLAFTNLVLNCIRDRLPVGASYLECDICGNRYNNRRKIMLHMIHHAKLYCCEICGIQMSNQGNLNVHMRRHTGERPFPCLLDSCDQRFIGTNDRARHMRIHRNEKPFKCEQCPKQFRLSGQLTLHIRSLHSNDRPFYCKDCDRSFKLRGAYTAHQLIHNGKRQFSCEVCGHAFFRRKALEGHMNVHNNTRPFMCSHCERGFSSTAGLRSHEKKIHNI